MNFIKSKKPIFNLNHCIIMFVFKFAVFYFQLKICVKKQIKLNKIYFFSFQNIGFTTVFELKSDSKDAVINRLTVSDLNHSRLAQIARYVAATGQVRNSILFT